MKTHRLKCWPQFFNLVISGAKRFEIRENDRDYRVGDVLELQEYEPGVLDHLAGKFTGRTYSVVVTYMTSFKQIDDYVVLSIEPCTVIVKTEAN